MVSKDDLKKQAAEKAVELVESKMVLGLGHGSTVQFALNALADKLRTGEIKGISCVPCSQKTGEEAKKLGIPLVDFDQVSSIDLTLDGADEIDPQLNLIKGGGGALLREKIVARASRREVIMADESKLSDKLGTRFPLPIEVAQFGWELQQEFVDELGGKPKLRLNQTGKPALTDQGNYLLDCAFGPIEDPHGLAQKLEARPGIVEHGLFLGLATDVIVGGANGLRHLKKKG